MCYKGHHKTRNIPMKSLAFLIGKVLLRPGMFLCLHLEPFLYYVSGRVMTFLSIF